ncbi:MAG: Denitrification system component NirT, partial [Betaproteobacteria bacterium]
MADMQPGGGWWSRLFSPSARYSVFTLLVAGIVLGIAGLLSFDYVLHATSTNE